MRPSKLPSLPQRQHGAVLFVALVFLVLLTLLAVAGMGTSIMQERMTGGMRNSQLGLMGAETGARAGESFLWNLQYVGTHPFPICTGSGSSVNCPHQPQIVGSSARLEDAVQTFRTQRTWITLPPQGGLTIAGLTGLSGPSQTASLAIAPQVLFEDLGPDLPPSAGCTGGAKYNCASGTAGKQEFYRVTSRSQGGSNAVLKVVETVYSAADLTNSGTNAGTGAGAGGP
jgi:type IV pilus assembly protein PilX